ncbi:FAD-binding protein [Sedimentibacter sp. MB31-C6]|uniref:FAD-binding protein n=1 Tax=Sedimentibacter sp. MB31-C6 TaxID=3109366 RepID=UPI002DDD4470|nr:FAD-binding protein [Sedimentibacter sp. MB36-C1]WSI03598.1 FAD-binding protein [Sedimentibacter sp. MB36-C1]
MDKFYGAKSIAAVSTKTLEVSISKKLKKRRIDGKYCLHEGETIEEIAAALEINAENLQLTIDSYNTYVDAQEDSEFARPDMPRKLEKAKFYAIEIGPAIHHTMGGLKINSNAEVLNTSGDVINGLFAAGEVTGGVHGGNRLGGNAVADIIVFGRMAGKTAVEYIK